MQTGIIVTVIVFCWGIWGILEKNLVMQVHPIIASIYLYCISMIFIPIYIIIAKFMCLQLQFDKSMVLWAFLTELSVAVAALLFLFLLSANSAYWVVAVTASYPVLTLILSSVFFKEAVSFQSILGVILVSGGLVLLNLK